MDFVNYMCDCSVDGWVEMIGVVLFNVKFGFGDDIDF